MANICSSAAGNWMCLC